MAASGDILVIRHGALGDVVLSTGPFAAIRRAHPEERIVLLTTKPYARLLAGSPYFDEVWIDAKPKLWQLAGMRRLVRQLNSRRFSRVYDLQTSQRSSSYRRLFRHLPEFSGIARGASHRHDAPERTRLHTIDRQKRQLALAGIDDVPPPDVTWMAEPFEDPVLPPRFLLIVPGGSPHRPEKRWPGASYAELCRLLVARGRTPVLIGGPAEAEVLGAIAAVPGVIDLGGRTNFGQIVALAMRADGAIGNDTGPMHLIAASGCPSLVLFSGASNPDLCAPRGEHVATVRRSPLDELGVDEVAALVPPDLDRLRKNPNSPLPI